MFSCWGNDRQTLAFFTETTYPALFTRKFGFARQASKRRLNWRLYWCTIENQLQLSYSREGIRVYMQFVSPVEYETPGLRWFLRIAVLIPTEHDFSVISPLCKT